MNALHRCYSRSHVLEFGFYASKFTRNDTDGHVKHRIHMLAVNRLLCFFKIVKGKLLNKNKLILLFLIA